MNGESGKGDGYRHQSAKEKREYDRSYLRVFGEPCLDCETRGWVATPPDQTGEFHLKCKTCDGLGYVERPKEKT